MFHLVQYLLPIGQGFFFLLYMSCTLSYPLAIHCTAACTLWTPTLRGGICPGRNTSNTVHRQRQRIDQIVLLSSCLRIIFAIITLSRSICVSLVELTDGERVGVEPNHVLFISFLLLPLFAQMDHHTILIHILPVPPFYSIV
jgi:hypothetical protein